MAALKHALIVLVVLTVLWDPFWRLMGVEQVRPWELAAAVDTMSGELAEAEVMDVRTPAEYDLVAIPWAWSEPYPVDVEAVAAETEPGGLVVVVCMTGHRSQLAAYSLQRELDRQGVNATAANLTWGMLGYLLSGGEADWFPEY